MAVTAVLGTDESDGNNAAVAEGSPKGEDAATAATSSERATTALLGRKRVRTTVDATTKGRKRNRNRPQTNEAQEECIPSVQQGRKIQDEGNPYRRH